MHHPHTRLAVAAAGLAAAAVMAAPQLGSTAAAAGGSHPHITATPNNVMVNGTVTLVGRNFAPSKKLVLRECGSKSWVVTRHMCSKGAIHVTTNKHGHFTQTFTATICPHSTWTGHPVTERRCYVGRPKPTGVDVIKLVGHARLIVTYP